MTKHAHVFSNKSNFSPCTLFLNFLKFDKKFPRFFINGKGYTIIYSVLMNEGTEYSLIVEVRVPSLKEVIGNTFFYIYC